MAVPLPLLSYRTESLALVLVAFSALAILYPVNTQDATRLALTQSALQRGSLNVDPYHSMLFDRAYLRGHWYSDKAPGMSILALPAVAALLAADSARGGGSSLPIWERPAELWLLRVVTSGLGLLVATFLVGRAAEGIRAGAGVVVAITFALGTIAGPLGAIMMEHDVSAALGFGAFLLATRGPSRLFLSGLLAGTMIVFDYTGPVVAGVIGVYVAIRYGMRLTRYLAGLAPGLVLLGVYDQAVFGSPFHLSYRYTRDVFTASQHQGLYGIHAPTWHGLWLVLGGSRGLLVVSPVLAAAVVGLVLLARRGLGLEAAAALALTAAYVLLEAGYFDVYGGALIGPRFLVPALPFVMFGLAEALARRPLLVGLLALVSIGLTSAVTFTWEGPYPNVVTTTIWSYLGAPRPLGVGLIILATLGAVALAARGVVRMRAAARASN